MSENVQSEDQLEQKAQDFMNVALDIGHFLIMAGAEIYRVEETIQRILYAYGAKHVDVFAITSQITVTLTLPNDDAYTRMRRIYSHGIDYTMLERLNSLSRAICMNRPPVEYVKKQLKEIYNGPKYGQKEMILAYGGIAFFFTLFFQGVVRDAFIAFFAGMGIRGIEIGMSYLHANRFFSNMVSSVFIVLVVNAAVWLGFAVHQDAIIIGSLMILVPGVAITNSIRDIIAGDLLAGMIKALEAFLVALALAMGAGLALILVGGL